MSTDLELYEKLTIKQIFDKYFRVKIILFLTIFIIAAIGRYYNYHQSFEYNLMIGLFSLSMAAAFVLGYLDYNFYENGVKKIISKLLNESPLIEFQGRGFGFEDNDKSKIYGEIDGYKIILAPLANTDGNKILTILIPLKIKDGLDRYFSKFDDLFKFSFTGKVLFCEAVIKNYQHSFDFDKLFNSINETIKNLKERNIEPVEITED